ncbi:hypothetical protein GOBAR_DD33038 [Gossypium barbadense]|nr:hypothetical protein GOBAR_DD33038 [Gossypium barbadense]
MAANPPNTVSFPFSMTPRPPTTVSFRLDHRHRVYLCWNCQTAVFNVPRYNPAPLNVHCKNCNELLGQKFILGGHIMRTPWQRFYAVEGPVLLHTDVMIYWDGRFLLWADNYERIDEGEEE